MSLDTSIRHCPFLLDSDVVKLSPGWSVTGSILYDAPIGARHIIEARGAPLMRAIAIGCQLDTLHVLAAKHRVSMHEVHSLLGLLNTLGALQRIRSSRQYVTALSTRLLHSLLGIWHAGLTWRKPATVRWLMVALLRATWPVAAATAIVSLLVAAAGFMPAHTTVITCAVPLALFVSSLCIHEITHLAFIRPHHPTPVLLQRGMRLGIVHPALPSNIELRTAVAGPVAGLITCLLTAVLCWMATAPLIAWLCVIAGLLHMGSLLPWYSDGIAVRRSLRSRHA